ncbi:hypothetical protein [Candidatus Amarobacter glycogenicus]|uniref:hypothetical protein n=1 Tax=Candidatus Amarobacter glycogenicus TaxID=3140699 RepID=UPI0031CCD70D
MRRTLRPGGRLVVNEVRADPDYIKATDLDGLCGKPACGCSGAVADGCGGPVAEFARTDSQGDAREKRPPPSREAALIWYE